MKTVYGLLATLFLSTSAQIVLSQPQGAATQTPQTTASSNPAKQLVGEVTAIDTGAMKITVKADTGATYSIIPDDKTNVLRAQPGAKTLDGATKISASEIAVGDRILAVVKISEDKKQMTVKTLVDMTKADIAKKQEHDRSEWQRRGISGTLLALNPETKEITLNVRSREGVKPVVVTTEGAKVDFRRYAPDSIKFSDAKASRFDDLKVGDQVRALGEKSTDGTHFTPEEIVSGSFRTVSGTVVSADATAGEIRIKDDQSKQQITVVVRPDTLLKRIPADMAAMFAGRGQGQGPGTGGANSQGATPQRPASDGGSRPEGSAGSSGARGNFGGGGGAGGFNLQDMLDKLPASAVADLKPGDMLIISSTNGADPNKVTAIAVVAGIEPIVNAMQARLAAQANRGQGSQQPSIGQGFGGTGLDFGMGLP